METAFDTCLETAKLAIKEFAESRSYHGALDDCANTQVWKKCPCPSL